MLKRRFTALFCAICLTLPLTGCSDFVREGLSDFLNIEIPSSDEEEAFEEIGHYDFTKIEEQIESMKMLWTQYHQEALLEAHISMLLNEFDLICEHYLRSEMAYYADWENDEKKAIYDAAYQDYNVASDMLSWVFTHGAHKSVYRELFEPYADETNTDYYLAYSLSKVKLNAKQMGEEYVEMLDDYYDIAYESSNDSEEMIEDSNLSCAQLYLDTIGQYDLTHCLYDFYGRDYEAEDVSSIYETIVEKIEPLYTKKVLALQSTEEYEKLDSMDLVVDENPFETVFTYGKKLSPMIAESADKLWNESLYTLGSGEGSYDGCYTVSFPSIPSAMIYLYTEGDYYDLMAAIHEFGHFHSDWRNETPLFCQQNQTDLAEIQSQGMQVLFTQFYDDLYGENADFMREFMLLDLLDSVVAGFAIGEFEQRVMQDYDSLSAEEVLAIYEEIAEDCALDIELYEISHLYEQPGYYISYGVSALATLQLYTKMQTSVEEAQRMYDYISGTSSVNGEATLCDTLEQSGFSDIFDPSALDALIAVLE